MNSIRTRLVAAAVLFLLAAVAHAQTATHSVYLDLDRNAATGCSVVTAAGTVTGAEIRVTATVTGQPPLVSSVVRESCTGAVFAAPQAQPSGYPVGLNLGQGGSDMVEFSTALSDLAITGAADLSFVSSTATGADLATAQGVPLPGSATFVPPAVIPSVGLLGLLVLIGAVLWLARKHPKFGSSMGLLLLLGAGVVWAANFVMDGQAGDWIGETPRSIDASNDSTSGEGSIDIVAVYAQPEAGRLFLRVDVREAQALTPLFTSATTTTFTVGTAGSFTVTATGTPTPTLSLSGGTLPAGVNFNAGTGVLSGTPGAGTGGTHALQFTATNSQGVATQNFTLVVNQAPAITSANATTFTAGAAGSFTVTASGFPAPTFALTGTPPAGVTLNPTTGVLSGTPAAGSGGSYALTITATNAAGNSAPQSFTLTVNDGPVFTSAATTTFTVGTAGTFTVTATGTPAPTLSLSSGTLPAGVSFTAATGVLSGTPGVGTGGTYALQFTATNTQGATPQNFTLTVNEAPAITSANATTFTVGNVSSFTVTASGFPAATFAITGTLPSGITFDTTTGVLGGTPGAATGGSYPLTFTATNVAGSSTPQNFTLTINDGPVFTSANTTTFSVGVAGSFTVTATGTPAPTLSLTNGTLPLNVTFTAATGVLSGTPAVGTGGSYPIEFTATNAQGTSTQNFTFLVNEAPTVTSANATSFTVGAAGSFTFTATGFPASTFALSGCALPGTISLNPTTGVLSGTPTAGQGGTYACTVTASNGVAPDATQGFTLTIDQAPAITSANATTFTVGTNGNFTVTTTGTPSPTLSVSGALPTGVNFTAATGLLSGTPADGTGGNYPITFTASNGVVPDATQNFVLTVNETPEITSANTATFTLNNLSSFTVTADGFPGATFAITGALPTGITFDTGTGVLSGTPTASGTFPLTFQATNVAGSSGVQNFTLNVNDGPVFTSANTTTFSVGVNGNFTVVATGTPAPTLGLTSGTPPANVTFTAGTGVLSGTPAIGTGGSYTLEFTATNVQGTSTQTFTLLVNEAPTITSANATTFAVGAAGSFTFTAAGFPASTFALSGCVLPGTISLNPTTGVLSGTPTPADGGTYACTVTASNGVAPDATQGFTLTINQTPAITSANATTFVVGTNGNFTVTATGTPTPTLSQSGALPLSVTFTPASGLLSGTPAVGTGGTYPLVFTAANGVLPDATQNFTLTVNEAPTITSANNTAFSVGSAGSFTITATGFPTPTLSLGVCTPALPGSISFTPGTGVLAGTPVNGDAGSYVCPVTASNGVGTDATQNFTLTINQTPVANDDAGAAFTADSGSTLTLPAGTLFADNGSGADTRGFPLANIASFGGGSAGGVVTTTPAGTADTAIPGFTNGSLTINADGGLAFTPPTTATRFCGAFTVNYRLTNTQGSDDATVTITVRCGPIAQDDAFANTFTSTPTGVSRSGDLFANNGSGADDLGSPAATLTSFGGGSLGGAVTSNAAGASVAFASGTLTVNANGTFSVVDVDVAGTFTFDYRLTNASGTDDGTVTFTIDAPPTVSIPTIPANGAVNVPNNTDITVNFSETVTLAAGAISVDCGAGVIAGALTGSGSASGVFNPGSNLPGNATCTVTVVSANVADTDTNDAPNNLDGDSNGIEGGNFVFSFQVAPSANDDAFTVTPHLSFLSPTSVKANDDPVTLTITGFGNSLGTANGTVPDGTNFITAGGAGGRVVLNLDGTFSYLPEAGDNAPVTATFFYTVTGGDTAQVTISFDGQQLIWFADDNAAGTVCTGGTNVGTQACPATTTGVAVANDTADDTLFFATGGYSCGITLLANQRLVGDGTTGTTLQALSGVIPVAGSSLPAFSGTAPTFASPADCVTLATGNVLRGFIIGDTGAASTDITGTAFGTATIDQVTLNGTGRALNLTTGTLSGGGFTSVASTASDNTGISLAGVGGTFSFGSTTIGGSTTQGILIGTSTVVLTLGNTSVTGGTDGISLENNPTGTFNFGTITRTGGSGTGFLHALNGGTVSAGATTISGTGNFGIDINGHLTPRTISFGATSVVKSSAGNAIGLGGANPNSGTVTFAELSGSTTAGAFLSAINNTGLLTTSAASTTAISAVGGPAFIITSTTTSPVALALGAVSSSGGAEGINLGNVTGTFSANGGTLSNATSTDVVLSGGTTTFTYGGSISDDVGALVSISGQTAGTKLFTGAITDGNDGDGSGVSLVNNTGATIRFSGGVQLSTGANPAFTATGGGTVEVCDENPCVPAVTGTLINTLATTTATALNVVGTNIGASHLTFRSITSTGAADAAGVILDGTGTSGGLRVTGTGTTDASGGTIANKTGANTWTVSGGLSTLTPSRIGVGYYFNNTENVQISNVALSGFSNAAVMAFDSRTIALTNVDITGANGDDVNADESAIYYYNLTSVAGSDSSIANSSIAGGFENNLQLLNTVGTLDRLTITGTTFGFNSTAQGNNNLLIESRNAGTVLNFTLTGSTIRGARADWINASNNSSSSMDAVIGGAGALANTFDSLGANTHPGPVAGGDRVVMGAVGVQTADVRGNTLRGSRGEAVRIRSTGTATGLTGTVDARVRDNVIGVAGTANSGSSESFGIFYFNDGGGKTDGATTGNQIFQYNNHGISVTVGDELPINNLSTVFNATVTGNTANTPGNINSEFNGIHLNNGTVAATDEFTSCVDIGGAGVPNNIVGSGNGVTPPNNQQFRLRQRQSTTVRLPGYGGANTDTAAVVTYVQGRNTVTAGNGAASIQGTGGFIGGAACTQPSFP